MAETFRCNAVNGMTGPVTKYTRYTKAQFVRCNAVNGMTGPVTAGSQNPHKYRGYRGHFSAPPAKNGQNAVILVGHCFENCLRISVFIKKIKTP